MLAGWYYDPLSPLMKLRSKTPAKSHTIVTLAFGILCQLPLLMLRSFPPLGFHTIHEETNMSSLEDEVKLQSAKAPSREPPIHRLHFFDMGSTPTEKQMEEYVTKVWRSEFKTKLLLHDDDYFLIKFASELDKRMMLDRGLSMGYWSSNALSKLESDVGKPLRIDIIKSTS
ncbi:hypothetical protein HAX54_039035 [Datura stramonium]|uniref:DUF4283 domain-containing protein n=1 Tax=Datura stramonium TaxID=4076 RepID=A0ABS8VKM0_DATST|nr:hypothetical protein [Datura stramonium]